MGTGQRIRMAITSSFLPVPAHLLGSSTHRLSAYFSTGHLPWSCGCEFSLFCCHTCPKEVVVALQTPETMWGIHECHLLAPSPFINLYKATLWGVPRPRAHRYHWPLSPSLAGEKVCAFSSIPTSRGSKSGGFNLSPTTRIV